MKILGVDPGDTTGWALYDTSTRRVEAAGEWVDCIRQDAGNCNPWHLQLEGVEVAVVERPRAYGTARPIMVDIGIVCGAVINEMRGYCRTYSLLRKSAKGRRDSVCDLLTYAVGCVRVSDDATAWAAVRELHGGDGADAKAKTRKGVHVAPPGPLGRCVGSHQRAAACVAIAWVIQQGIVDYSKEICRG